MRIAAPLVAIVGLVAVLGAQAPTMETMPVHGQVSLISAGATNVIVQVGPQGVQDATAAPSHRCQESIRGGLVTRPYGVDTARPDLSRERLQPRPRRRSKNFTMML